MDDAATADAATPSDEGVMKSVADGMRDAAATATEHAAKVRAAVEDAGPKALRAVSRATYTTAYTISYGFVYASVFIARSLPQDNAFMHGLHDGGVAARDALTGGE
ncbi:MAG TPA: hypothetical protein VJY39_12190 [Acidisphaera sp.]|nr:hypothetical protein [Acidisphaera sp.]